MERQGSQDEEDWEDDEEGWDPNEPSHPDYDLSEAAGYGARDYREGQAFPSRAMVMAASLLLLAAILAPFIIRLLR